MTQTVSLVNRRLRASMRRPDARLLPLPARAARACCCRAWAPGSARGCRAHNSALTGAALGAARPAPAAARHRRCTRRASQDRAVHRPRRLVRAGSPQAGLPVPADQGDRRWCRMSARMEPARGLLATAGALARHTPRQQARCAPAPADYDTGARHASARGPIPYTLYPGAHQQLRRAAERLGQQHERVQQAEADAAARHPRGRLLLQ